MAKKKKKKIKKTAKKKTMPSAAGKQQVTPHPTAGPRVIEFEQAIDDQLNQSAAEEIKRPPGRPAKAKEGEGPGAVSFTDPNLVKGVVKLPFEFWAVSTGVDKLRLSDGEASMIADPAIQVADLFLPGIDPRYYAVGGLLLSVIIVVTAKLQIIAEEKKRRSEVEAPKPIVTPTVQPRTGTPETIKFPDDIGTKDI